MEVEIIFNFQKCYFLTLNDLHMANVFVQTTFQAYNFIADGDIAEKLTQDGGLRCLEFLEILPFWIACDLEYPISICTPNLAHVVLASAD